MVCPRCDNEDPQAFYHGRRGWYCRRCVKFSDAAVLPEETSRLVDPEYRLKFTLTPAQQKVSAQLTEAVRRGKSVLLEAVCGAGKTEIVYQMIADQLARGKKVGFAIARRQVVLEIAGRLRQAFPHLKVVPVCQGFTRDVSGDLVVCTTHQLFRFRGRFDVLIIDEPDAFPFKGDETLHGIARHSCRGATVYLTATPDEQLLDRAEEGTLEHLYLSRRPHGHPLCLPRVVIGGSGKLLVAGALWLIRQIRAGKPVILFVPSRRTGRIFYSVLRRVVNCCRVDSQSRDRDAVLEAFRDGKYQLCVATSVLERGITVPGVQVAVWRADHPVFDEAALVQISGRVGRSFRDPEGSCLFLCGSRQRPVDRCLDDIRRANDG